jgi:putative membrane protein
MFMNIKIGLLAGALAFSVAGCMTPTANAPAPMMAVTTAAQFVPMATSSNTFEIESSRLALRRSRDPEVRRFAQQMIRDHNMAGRRMMTAARRSGMTAPAPMLNAKHEGMLATVNSAQDFDTAYVTAQLAAHQEAVALFSSYASNGDNAQLVEFAKMTLPTLQMHLEHVQDLSGGGTTAHRM